VSEDRDEEYGDRLSPPGGPSDDDTAASGAGAEGPGGDGDDGQPVGDAPGTAEPPAGDDADAGGEGGLRNRLRRRLGLGESGWLVVETLALVAPYPLFVWVLLFTDVPELPFLLATAVYSVLATVFGFGTLGEFLE